MNKWRKVHRAILSTVSLIGSLCYFSTNAGGAPVPSVTSLTETSTSLTGYSSMAIDEVNKRVYVASRTDAAVIALDFNGTVIASRTGFAQPSALTIENGEVFVLLTGNGSIAKLNPVTLEPTTILAGRYSPEGLTSNNGYLYFFDKAPHPTTTGCIGSSPPARTTVDGRRPLWVVARSRVR